MSAARKPRLRKAATLVPLAALSVAWTASVAGLGGPGLVAATPQTPAGAAAPVGTLPDGASLPPAVVEAPASVSEQASVAGATGNATQIVSTSSTSGIPSAALAAYQRAETVINAADTTCQLPWQLVAAIGRVESNHGRFGGNVLDDAGVATPGIVGIPLDGTNDTALINDTDAGQYDADLVFDRAVGPMQFIPSTWSVVGVDADGDGVRNPQDIDDAALGSAVYLCSGDDDLSTEAGQRAATFRYNNSESYVDLVLSVMAAYTAGDFTSIPNSTVAAGQLVIAPPAKKPAPVRSGGDGSGSTSEKSTKDVLKPTPAPTPTQAPAPTQPPAPQPSPTDKSTNGGGGGGNNNNGGSGNGGNNTPPVDTNTPVPTLPSTGLPPVDGLLSNAQARVQCLTELGIDPDAGLIGGLTGALTSKLDDCILGYTTAP